MAEQKNVGKKGNGKNQRKSNRKKLKNAKPAPVSRHEAYRLRDKYPEKVLCRICKSSGYLAAEKYAQEQGLLEVLSWLIKTSLFQRKLEEAKRKNDQNYVPIKQRLKNDCNYVGRNSCNCVERDNCTNTDCKE